MHQNQHNQNPEMKKNKRNKNGEWKSREDDGISDAEVDRVGRLRLCGASKEMG